MTAIPPTLTRRTATRFHADNIPALARYLMHNKFASVLPACGDPRIYGRFSHAAGSQVILYHSGAVRVQDDTAAGVDFCAALCDPEGVVS